MKNVIAFDTEFYENGISIRPISIGMVKVDTGEELYLEFMFDWSSVPEDHWIQKNVGPYLRNRPTHLGEIRKQLLQFCGFKPTFVGWYCQYDMVLLQQIWGTMMQYGEATAASDWPLHAVDLKALADIIDPSALMPRDGREHNALDDARNIAKFYEMLRRIENRGESMLL